jgi:KaiC/GvpD/RAD55 family RecA-like ATPase
MMERISKTKPARVVIDSITNLMIYKTKPEWMKPKPGMMPVSLYVPTIADVRRSIFALVDEIRKTGATIILIAETGSGELGAMSEIIKIIVDGTLTLSTEQFGTTTDRALVIEKMRRTKHPLDIFPMYLTSKGLELKSLEEAFHQQ